MSSQDGKKVLILDGGGVRGVAMLVMLNYFMNDLNSAREKDGNRPLLPCQYFDLVVGTSTGGLIALMLVRLRMSAEDCLEIYRDLCRKIFEPVWNASFFKYSSHNYEMELKEVISQRLGSGHQNDPLRDPFAEDGCKCIALALDMTYVNAPEPRLLRNWKHANDNYNITIWQAARATSAAPFYFEPLCFEHLSQPLELVDAGYAGFNDPVHVALHEANTIWGDDKVQLRLSLGTGLDDPIILKKKGVTQIYEYPRNVIKGMAAAATDRARAAVEVGKYQYPQDKSPGQWFRFDPLHLGKIKLDDCESASQIEPLVTSYIATHMWNDSNRCRLRMRELMPVDRDCLPLNNRQLDSHERHVLAHVRRSMQNNREIEFLRSETDLWEDIVYAKYYHDRADETRSRAGKTPDKMIDKPPAPQEGMAKKHGLIGRLLGHEPVNSNNEASSAVSLLSRPHGNESRSALARPTSSEDAIPSLTKLVAIRSEANSYYYEAHCRYTHTLSELDTPGFGADKFQPDQIDRGVKWTTRQLEKTSGFLGRKDLHENYQRDLDLMSR